MFVYWYDKVSSIVPFIFSFSFALFHFIFFRVCVCVYLFVFLLFLSPLFSTLLSLYPSVCLYDYLFLISSIFTPPPFSLIPSPSLNLPHFQPFSSSVASLPSSLPTLFHFVRIPVTDFTLSSDTTGHKPCVTAVMVERK